MVKIIKAQNNRETLVNVIISENPALIKHGAYSFSKYKGRSMVTFYLNRVFLDRAPPWLIYPLGWHEPNEYMAINKPRDLAETPPIFTEFSTFLGNLKLEYRTPDNFHEFVTAKIADEVIRKEQAALFDFSDNLSNEFEHENIVSNLSDLISKTEKTKIKGRISLEQVENIKNLISEITYLNYKTMSSESATLFSRKKGAYEDELNKARKLLVDTEKLPRPQLKRRLSKDTFLCTTYGQNINFKEEIHKKLLAALDKDPESNKKYKNYLSGLNPQSGANYVYVARGNDILSFVVNSANYDLETGTKQFKWFLNYTIPSERHNSQMLNLASQVFDEAKAKGCNNISVTTLSGSLPGTEAPETGYSFFKLLQKILGKEAVVFPAEGEHTAKTAIILLYKADLNNLMEHLKGEKAFIRRLTKIKPAFETIFFQWIGTIVSLVLPALGITFWWLPLAGFLWSTLGFSLAHNFQRAGPEGNGKAFDFSARFVLSFGLSIINFIPYIATVLPALILSHPISSLVLIIVLAITTVFSRVVYEIHSKFNELLYKAKNAPESLPLRIRKHEGLAKLLKKLPYLAIWHHGPLDKYLPKKPSKKTILQAQQPAPKVPESPEKIKFEEAVLAFNPSYNQSILDTMGDIFDSIFAVKNYEFKNLLKIDEGFATIKVKDNDTNLFKIIKIAGNEINKNILNEKAKVFQEIKLKYGRKQNIMRHIAFEGSGSGAIIFKDINILSNPNLNSDLPVSYYDALKALYLTFMELNNSVVMAEEGYKFNFKRPDAVFSVSGAGRENDTQLIYDYDSIIDGGYGPAKYTAAKQGMQEENNKNEESSVKPSDNYSGELDKRADENSGKNSLADWQNKTKWAIFNKVSYSIIYHLVYDEISKSIQNTTGLPDTPAKIRKLAEGYIAKPE